MAKRNWILTLVILGAAAAVGSAETAAAERKAASVFKVKGGGAVLVRAVWTARRIALDRLGARAECGELFRVRGADGARILLEADYRAAETGEAGGLCEQGASAFTGMTSRRTAVCTDAFLKLDPHTRATVLLHEALHVAGLGQHPLHAGAMTARQIDEMVGRSCGL
jgi:hypothetical protein